MSNEPRGEAAKPVQVAEEVVDFTYERPASAAVAIDYQRPSAYDASQYIVQRGKELIVPRHVILPALCIKTGEPVEPDGRPLMVVDKKFYWTPPLLVLLIFVPYIGLLLLLVALLRAAQESASRIPRAATFHP